MSTDNDDDNIRNSIKDELPPLASEKTELQSLGTKDTPSTPTRALSVPSDGSLERMSTNPDHEGPNQASRTLTTTSQASPPHSVFTRNQKRFIVVMASWAGFFSPVSSNIYFPALNSLAKDLRVSSTLINLTLTSYMIFQGLAPAFIGDLADVAGRRPAYMTCFVLYCAANIGLALQNNYAALFVLRCLQSSGSSGTIALSSGVVADVATVAERGSYMGFVTAGALLGPAIGPVIGGVLAQFLGWRAIFWFLFILGASFLSIFVIFFPETARTAVGDGSIAPKGLNMSVMNYLAVRKARQEAANQLNDLTRAQSRQSTLPQKQSFRFPNPLSSIHIFLDVENALLLLYNALLFCVFYDLTVAIPSMFAETYGFNDLQIGLCYIPFGVGSFCAALSNGQLLDRNFRRWAKHLNVELKKGRQTDLQNFPIEKARLGIAFPCVYASLTLVIIYGWVLDINGPLAAILVLLFFISYFMTCAFNVTSTLLVDFYPHSPATATGANNLIRCVLGAGATAAVVPMINAMGRGWTYTLLGLFLLASSPMLWLVYFRGMGWREKRRLRDEAQKRAKANRRSGAVEEDLDEKAVGGPEEAATLTEATNQEDIGRRLGRVVSRREAGRTDLHRTFSRQSGF